MSHQLLSPYSEKHEVQSLKRIGLRDCDSYLASSHQSPDQSHTSWIHLSRRTYVPLFLQTIKTYSPILVLSKPQDTFYFGFTRPVDLNMKIRLKTTRGKRLRIPSRTNYHSRLSTLAANNKPQNRSIKKMNNFDRQVYPSQKQTHHSSLRKPHHESTGVFIAKTNSSFIPAKIPPSIDRCIHRKKQNIHSSTKTSDWRPDSVHRNFDQQVYPSQK